MIGFKVQDSPLITSYTVLASIAILSLLFCLSGHGFSPTTTSHSCLSHLLLLPQQRLTIHSPSPNPNPNAKPTRCKGNKVKRHFVGRAALVVVARRRPAAKDNIRSSLCFLLCLLAALLRVEQETRHNDNQVNASACVICSSQDSTRTQGCVSHHVGLRAYAIDEATPLTIA